MPKKILLINSNGEECLKPFISIIEEMKSRGYSFEIWINNSTELSSFAKENSITIKKYKPRLKIKNSKFAFLFFMAILPILFLYYLIIFKFKISKKKTDVIFCFDWYEKIIFSMTNIFFKKKLLFIELPRKKIQSKCKLLNSLYRKLSKKASVVALNNDTFQKLCTEKIPSSLISLGVRPKSFARQESIFSNLAKTNQENSEHNKNKRFFTIGTVTNFNNKQHIEILFSAAKKCLSVISNLQVIIVGEGEEKKNLSWIAKKMGIENIVWFVGKQKLNKKWLDNFDAYVITDDFINLDNSYLCLQALDSSLPLIGPIEIGADDLVKNGENGYLISFNDSENLAQKIIKLNQKKFQSSKFGEASKELIDKSYNTANMVDGLEKILKQL